MDRDIILLTCDKLAKAIDDKKSNRVYSSVLFGGLFSGYEGYEEVLEKIVNSSDEDLIGQAQHIYSMASMKVLVGGR